MDDCEKMLIDAWLILCGPCIINIPEEFSNLEISKKCDLVLILNNDKDNGRHQYDGFTHCKITTMIWFYAIRAYFVVVVSIRSVIQKIAPR